jgi:hypothetical protein
MIVLPSLFVVPRLALVLVTGREDWVMVFRCVGSCTALMAALQACPPPTKTYVPDELTSTTCAAGGNRVGRSAELRGDLQSSERAGARPP